MATRYLLVYKSDYVVWIFGAQTQSGKLLRVYMPKKFNVQISWGSDKNMGIKGCDFTSHQGILLA